MAIEERTTWPRLEAARSWLSGHDDPRTAVVVARLMASGPDDLAAARARLTGSSVVREAFARQRPDGSWGEAEDARSRILPTLWMVKLLAELGIDDGDDRWQAGVGFLAGRAHASTGVFSSDGTDAGVLSCYVGIAGETYLRGGRADLAEPQVAWIVRHQEIRVGGGSRRQPTPVLWDERLRMRYGGCMASTTCLIGLVKTGHALRRWLERSADEPASEMLDATREVFLERRLLYRGDGSLLSLGGSGAQAERWLEPAFPLDWHTDLVEVLDLVAVPGVADERVRPAIERLAATQLADGSWPLRVSYVPPDVPALERRSRQRGSTFVTSRIVGVLDRLAEHGDTDP
ncbi:MAG: hypothetical protein AB1Z63_11695 [Candidatus Limnocylindrales bacterium]